MSIKKFFFSNGLVASSRMKINNKEQKTVNKRNIFDIFGQHLSCLEQISSFGVENMNKVPM